MGDGWEYIDTIIPGNAETLQTWIYKKVSEVIQIELFVFLQQDLFTAYKSAQYRFLELGSLSTLPGPPFKKEPLEPCWQYAALNQSSNYRQFLGTIYNITCRITGWNTSADILEVSKKVSENITKKNELTFFNRNLGSRDEEVSIMSFSVPPGINNSANEIEIIKVGERVSVLPGFETDNILMDFAFNREDKDISSEVENFPGIQLVKKEDNKLTFQGCKKSTNVITVTTVDKNTLLCSSRRVTIKVE